MKETFQLKLEMKNFENNEKVIDNFRRRGLCKILPKVSLIFTFLLWFSRRSSVPPNKNGAFHILRPKPINIIEFEIQIIYIYILSKSNSDMRHGMFVLSKTFSFSGFGKI